MKIIGTVLAIGLCYSVSHAETDAQDSRPLCTINIDHQFIRLNIGNKSSSFYDPDSAAYARDLAIQSGKCVKPDKSQLVECKLSVKHGAIAILQGDRSVPVMLIADTPSKIRFADAAIKKLIAAEACQIPKSIPTCSIRPNDSTWISAASFSVFIDEDIVNWYYDIHESQTLLQVMVSAGFCHL